MERQNGYPLTAMEFLDRQDELERLERLVRTGGLAVVWGRRRVGKTRLLLEWRHRHDGLYTVADRSAPAIQRRYLAAAIAARFPRFDEVEYPDWRALLRRLGEELKRTSWAGPLIFDEFPYLVAASPEMPSVFQAWVDHDLPASGATVAIAGSSQRMMQGLVLDASEPLYGRAKELLHLRPLPAGHIAQALKLRSARDGVSAYAAGGGFPRYWELAAESGLRLDDAVDHLALGPLGVLHREPELLLLEELPPAVALRPVLDAIGLGAHRLSEIAGRVGQPATSLTGPMQRLQELGLVRREVPFGESAKSSKRSVYKIADPFFRLWFRVVAPNRGLLVEAPASVRRSLWQKARPALMAEAWEELCRQWVPVSTSVDTPIPQTSGWEPAGRFWHGDGPEWDVVSRSLDGNYLLLSEAKWHAKPAGPSVLCKAARALLAKGVPSLRDAQGATVVYAIFVPDVAGSGAREVDGVTVVTASQVLEGLR